MPIVGGGGASDHGALLGLTDDDHPQYILGDASTRSTGQHLGGGTKPTGGIDSTDFSTYGRLILGTVSSEADAYTDRTALIIKRDIPVDTAVTTGYLLRAVLNVIGTGAALANNIFGLRTEVIGGSGYTSGTMLLVGNSVTMAPVVSAGASAQMQGLIFMSTPSGAGSFTTILGAQLLAQGSSTAGATGTNIIACQGATNSLAQATTNVIAFQAANPGGTVTAAVTQATAYDVSSTFMNDADVTTWSGLRISTGLTAAIANKWSLDLTNTSTNMGSRIAHKIALGWNPSTVSAITARLMLAAGATGASAAPLKFQSGSLQTTAEAGAMEFLTDDFFLTITTGAARKGIILDDGSRLTSGRVPFATTNGRLIDDADFTFAIDTLTVTKIAATTFVGDVAHDTKNITTDGTTGTKIGTANTQKWGFWGATPIVQPTTAVAAATFVANTSGIVDDSATFDGYTLGQVVKALRNMGLLA